MNRKYRVLNLMTVTLTSPDKAQVLSLQRRIVIAQAALVEDCDKYGIRPKSTYDLTSKQ